MCCCCCPQVGLGGGMKAGINIWVAKRHNSYTHKAWAHLAGKPVRPEDLPRPINEQDAALVAAAAAAKEAAMAEAAARHAAVNAAATPTGSVKAQDGKLPPAGVLPPLTPEPGAERLLRA